VSSIHPFKMPAKNRGTKRAGHDDEHQVKKAKVDPMVGAILEAIDLTQDMQTSCKSMLAAMVPEAFTVPADERHSYQTMFVDIVGECVRKTEENMKMAVGKEHEHASELSSKQDTLEKNIEDARKIHGDKKTIMEQHKAKLAELFRAVLENRIALSSSQQALDVAAAPVAELKKEVDACHKAISEDLAALRDVAVEASAAEEISTKLITLSAHLGLEETLATSLPVACTKKAADRGAFDVMVLEQFEKEVMSKAAGFEAQVQTTAANVAALEKALDVAQKKLDETTSAHHAASDVLNAAIAEEKKTFSAHSDCQAELASFKPLLKAATDAVEEKQAALDNYQTWNVASFDMLKVKASKPQPTAEEMKPVAVCEDATLQQTSV